MSATSVSVRRSRIGGEFRHRLSRPQIAERGKKDLYLRSDERAHTLCYRKAIRTTRPSASVEDEASLQEAASTLKRSAMPLMPERRRKRATQGTGVIGFRDPTAIISIVCGRSAAAALLCQPRCRHHRFSHIASTPPIRPRRAVLDPGLQRPRQRPHRDIPLMRSMRSITPSRWCARQAGIQHINHQVETSDDVLRSYYFLNDAACRSCSARRHPTSGARFLYFKTGWNDLRIFRRRR